MYVYRLTYIHLHTLTHEYSHACTHTCTCIVLLYNN